MEDRELLLEVLLSLSQEEYRLFVFFLGDKRLDPPLSRTETDNVSKTELVQTLEQVYTDRSSRIASEIMKKIKRNDLWEKLNKIPSGFSLVSTCASSVQETHGGNWPGVQEKESTNRFQDLSPVSAHQQKGLCKALVTDKQLMQVAKKIGKSWKEIGIEFLGIENIKIDQIEGDNQNHQVMKTFCMLKAWKNKERNKATADQLYQLLSQEDVPIEPEAYEFLNKHAV